MRFLILFPLALTISGFVLSFLCIFAGNKPGFMNDYQLVTLNTSRLGHNLISDPSPAIPKPITDLFPEIPAGVSGISGQLNGLIGDASDMLTQELGIRQWYGWHILNFCEGKYKPNATAQPAEFQVTDCSAPTSHFHFKIADVINSQLLMGPLHISLKDLKWPDDIQKEVDQLNTAVPAALTLYAISISAAGIAILTTLLVFFGYSSLWLTVVNWALTGLSFLSLFIASIIISVINHRATNVINEKGNGVGLYAYKGKKYLALTWCSMAVMLVTFLFWNAWFFLGRTKTTGFSSEKAFARKFVLGRST
ncbi:hypothetical protein K3495_g9218 [Podosphaera aphanis]|nr:hypothetical protein K3495_g9218 [Podosphaera aphanis]